MDHPRATLPPIQPLSASNGNAEIANLKKEIARLAGQVEKHDKDIEKIWAKAKAAGIHR